MSQKKPLQAVRSKSSCELKKSNRSVWPLCSRHLASPKLHLFRDDRIPLPRENASHAERAITIKNDSPDVDILSFVAPVCSQQCHGEHISLVENPSWVTELMQIYYVLTSTASTTQLLVPPFACGAVGNRQPSYSGPEEAWGTDIHYRIRQSRNLGSR